MVDRLKKSLDELEPPECGRCCKPMTWFSAQLMVEPKDVIEHTFFCPTCGNSTRVHTQFTPPAGDAPPPLRMRENVIPFSRLRAPPRRPSAA